MNFSQPLILASKSPRRKHLLELAEVPFEVVALDTEEHYPLDLPLEKVPDWIAKKKAQAAHILYPERCILAADTVVVLDGEIIGKPEGHEDAKRILSRLASHTHIVITGVCVLYQGKEICFSDHTEVTFHPLTDEDIDHYVSVYKPFDKAGAYAIQEWIGAIAIQKINGCFYNVMGLPISRVVAALKSLSA
jgi:septum formation protein